MNDDEVVKALISIRDYLCSGNPIWNVDTVREVMDKAITAVKKQNMVDGYDEKLGSFEQEERQTCETCYYVKFDGLAYPCSRCIHNKPIDDMWQPKEQDHE